MIDNKLTFNPHVEKLCKKASQRLHALIRIAPFMSTIQKKMIMCAFIKSQFNYCPLVWMLHNRRMNNMINKIHEKSLRIVYNDYDLSFEHLLLKDKSVSIHHRNLQILATEIYKVKHNSSPEIMSDIFENRSLNYNLRNNLEFKTHNVHSEKYGINTISYLGPRIWSILPEILKNAPDLLAFKRQIKSWIPKNCPCKLCAIYVVGLGYLP